MVSTQRRSRSPRSEVASRSLTARIPVNGVRTSCAKAASAASTISGFAFEAERLLRRARFDGARELITIDGVRAEFDDGFGLVRASNTTPVLVLRFEGETPQALERIQAQFMAAIKRVKPDAQVGAGH